MRVVPTADNEVISIGTDDGQIFDLCFDCVDENGYVVALPLAFPIQSMKLGHSHTVPGRKINQKHIGQRVHVLDSHSKIISKGKIATLLKNGSVAISPGGEAEKMKLMDFFKVGLEKFLR